MTASSVKAAIYVRQSKDNLEGIERGLNEARRMVEGRGWTLVGEYADNAVSASKDRKPGTDWSRLLDDIQAGKVDTVVGIDMDRLLRRVHDVLELINLGVTIVTLDGDLNTTTAEGRRRAIDQANGAQFETDRKSERQIRANNNRRNLEGGALPVPGKRRFGYQKGNILLDPEEAPLVRWAFAEVLAGSSVYSIAKGLGKGVDTVGGVLRNPAYAGWLTRGEYTKGRRVTMELIEADPRVERIVSRGTFEQAQVILSTKQKTSPGNKVRWLVSGLASCSVCGGVVRYNAGNYRCKVGHVLLEAEVLEREVIEELLYVLRAPEGISVESPELVALNVQEAELIRQRQAAQQIALMPGADMAHLGRELTRIASELDTLEVKRKTYRLQLAKAELGAAVMGAWEFDGWEQDALDAWVTYFRGLPLEHQRELVRDNLRIVVGRGRTVETLSVEAK